MVNAHLARHHGVITLAEAKGRGLTRGQIQYRLDHGLWVPFHRGVYGLGGVQPSAETRTAAACTAAGPDAGASHCSAGWLWELIEQPPGVPAITVPYPQRASAR